jgi:hypothetical protein
MSDDALSIDDLPELDAVLRVVSAEALPSLLAGQLHGVRAQMQWSADSLARLSGSADDLSAVELSGQLRMLAAAVVAVAAETPMRLRVAWARAERGLPAPPAVPHAGVLRVDLDEDGCDVVQLFNLLTDYEPVGDSPGDRRSSFVPPNSRGAGPLGIGDMASLLRQPESASVLRDFVQQLALEPDFVTRSAASATTVQRMLEWSLPDSSDAPGFWAAMPDGWPSIDISAGSPLKLQREGRRACREAVPLHAGFPKAAIALDKTPQGALCSASLRKSDAQAQKDVDALRCRLNPLVYLLAVLHDDRVTSISELRERMSGPLQAQLSLLLDDWVSKEQ